MGNDCSFFANETGPRGVEARRSENSPLYHCWPAALSDTQWALGTGPSLQEVMSENIKYPIESKLQEHLLKISSSIFTEDILVPSHSY